MKRYDPMISAQENVIEGLCREAGKLRSRLLIDEATMASSLSTLRALANKAESRERVRGAIAATLAAFDLRAARFEGAIAHLLANIDIVCATYSGSRRRFLDRRAQRVRDLIALLRADVARIRAGLVAAQAA